MVTKDIDLARSIPPWLSGIVERLELDRPPLVTIAELEIICAELGITTPARVVASKLRERGWLLATPLRGVWEFIPGETAGAISSADPLLSVQAFDAANPEVENALAQQTGAWALGLSDRIPARKEVAFSSKPHVKTPDDMRVLTYAWNLVPVEQRGVRILAPESILVQMAHRPNSVRSWESAQEWLPDVAYEMEIDATLFELEGKSASTWARTGYLLQGMRPDIAAAIAKGFSPRGKVRIGTKGPVKRNDERWQISDYILPFDPREMESVR